MEAIKQLAVKLTVFMVNMYRWLIRPVIGDHCRFTPSCSTYAKEALVSYGVIKGISLIVKRLARCHPFAPGGYDPVKKCEK